MNWKGRNLVHACGTIVLGLILMLFGQGAWAQDVACEKSKGQIIAKAITRGTLQYLLVVNDEIYCPDDLPKQFRKDSLTVWVNFEKTEKMDTVYKPAPNDLIEVDFLAPVVKLKKIRKYP